MSMWDSMQSAVETIPVLDRKFMGAAILDFSLAVPMNFRSKTLVTTVATASSCQAQLNATVVTYQDGCGLAIITRDVRLINVNALKLTSPEYQHNITVYFICYFRFVSVVNKKYLSIYLVSKM